MSSTSTTNEALSDDDAHGIERPHLLDFSGWTDRPSDIGEPGAGEIHADVLVIGGGYCGMTAALHLARAGAEVVVAEAEFCGWGASSRNAGHLTPTIASDPQILATVYQRKAPDLIGFASRALHFTEQLISQLGIECDYAPVGNVSAATTPAGMRRSNAIVRRLERAGASVELVDAQEFGLPAGMLGGILEREGGTLDPGRLAAGLRARLRDQRGVRVLERTPVHRVERHGTRLRASIPLGTITTDAVLLATNAFSAGISMAPRRAVAPLWVTLAETAPIGAADVAATGWTSAAGIYTQHLLLENYRLTHRSSIIVGTRRVTRAKPPLVARTPDPRTVQDLQRAFDARFPSLAGSAGSRLHRAWGGWVAMTTSLLPIAGQTPEGLHYAMGFNGHGLAQAPYVGHLMAKRLLGANANSDLDTIWRKRPRYAPTPQYSNVALRLAWGIDRLTDRMTSSRLDSAASGDRPR